jgi:hypothetical protein
MRDEDPFDLIATCEPFTSAETCVHRPESTAAVVWLLLAEVRRLRESLECIAAPDDLLDANEEAFNPMAARRMQEQARYALNVTT